MVSQIKDLSVLNKTLPYQGYIWMSNKSFPEVFANTQSLNLAEIIGSSSFPFIIEGNFCTIGESERFSIKIQHIDGDYKVTKFDLSTIDEKPYLQKYVGHDLNGLDYQMIEYWALSEPDELLAGMSTMQPAWSAFYGFVNK